jgi:hypothetical protein
MFLSDWRVLIRRWYIVVLGLLATVALCYAATVFVPVSYEATADVLLLPPKVNTIAKAGATATTQPDNPFLALGGLDTVSAVLSKTLSDRATQLTVQQAGGTGTFTVVQDLTAGGPVLLVTVTASTPAATLRTLAAVTGVVPLALARLQTTSGVPANALIRSKVITRDNIAQPVRKSQLRAMMAAAAAGLGGTVLLTALVDGYLARRRGGRVAAAPAPAPPAAADLPRPMPGEPVPWPPRAATARLAAGAAQGAGTPFSATPHRAPNGSAPNGSAANGSVPNGGFSNGGFSNGSAANGGFSNGSVPNGSFSNGSAAGRTPAVPAVADPDATVVLHRLEVAADLPDSADLPDPAPETRSGRTGSRRHGWERNGWRDSAG